MQPEIVDQYLPPFVVPDGRLVFQFDHHLEAHVLEQRQHVRQRDRPVRVINLEADLGFRFLGRPVDMQADGAGGQHVFDDVDILEGPGAVVAFPVAGIEGVGITVKQIEALLFAVGLDQGVAQPVRPGPGRLDQAGFDFGRVIGRDLPRGGADNHVQTGQGQIAELGVVGGDFAIEGLAQNVLQVVAEGHGIAVPGHVDQARHEAFEIVATDEQRHSLAVLQVQDAEAGFEQGVIRNLEQFVAGKGFQNVHQRLAVVAAGGEAGPFQRFVKPPAQHGYIAGAAAVGNGGKQPDEKALTDDPAHGVEPLDADGVHMHGPMNSRFLVGLGHQQQVRGFDEFPYIAGRCFQFPEFLEDDQIRVAEDP